MILFGKEIHLNTFNNTFISESLKTNGVVTGGQAVVEEMISMYPEYIEPITPVYYSQLL